MTISEMQKTAWETSESKGFHMVDQHPAIRLMLVVSELAEAVEELRKGFKVDKIYNEYKDGKIDPKPEGFPIEVADAVIRLADLAECSGFDLEDAIRTKLEFNKTRPFMHGGRRF